MLKIENRKLKIENQGIETWSPAERAAWSAPEKMTVVEWADRFVNLPARTAFGGKYSSSLTPYMRGPLNAFADPEIGLAFAYVPNGLVLDLVGDPRAFALAQAARDCAQA